MHRHFDVLATWREKAAGDVAGQGAACGHYPAGGAARGRAGGIQGLLRLSLRGDLDQVEQHGRVLEPLVLAGGAAIQDQPAAAPACRLGRIGNEFAAEGGGDCLRPDLQACHAQLPAAQPQAGEVHQVAYRRRRRAEAVVDLLGQRRRPRPSRCPRASRA